MKYADFITQDRCIPDLESTNKEDVIKEILGVFSLNKKEFSKNYGLIIEREKKGTTGMGEGIAIPHTSMSDIPKIVGAFARSREGVEFEALDGKLVHLIFMVISPESRKEEHVECLKYISKKMKNELYKSFLMDAKGKRGIFRTLKEMDEKG